MCSFHHLANTSHTSCRGCDDAELYDLSVLAKKNTSVAMSTSSAGMGPAGGIPFTMSILKMLDGVNDYKDFKSSVNLFPQLVCVAGLGKAHMVFSILFIWVIFLYYIMKPFAIRTNIPIIC